MHRLNYTNTAKPAVFDSIHHNSWDFREVAGKRSSFSASTTANKETSYHRTELLTGLEHSV